MFQVNSCSESNAINTKEIILAEDNLVHLCGLCQLLACFGEAQKDVLEVD